MSNIKKNYYVYFLSNKNRTVIYIGYSGQLDIRINQHENREGALFTKQYNAHDILRYELYATKSEAIARENQLKNWHKEWKWNLIKESNPNLRTISIEEIGFNKPLDK